MGTEVYQDFDLIKGTQVSKAFNRVVIDSVETLHQYLLGFKSNWYEAMPIGQNGNTLKFSSKNAVEGRIGKAVLLQSTTPYFAPGSKAGTQKCYVGHLYAVEIKNPGKDSYLGYLGTCGFGPGTSESQQAPQYFGPSLDAAITAVNKQMRVKSKKYGPSFSSAGLREEIGSATVIERAGELISIGRTRTKRLWVEARAQT